MSAGKSEQGLERGHWRAPAVETEDKLVEGRLEMLGIDAVVGPTKPGLEVAEGFVNAR